MQVLHFLVLYLVLRNLLLPWRECKSQWEWCVKAQRNETQLPLTLNESWVFLHNVNKRNIFFHRQEKLCSVFCLPFNFLSFNWQLSAFANRLLVFTLTGLKLPLFKAACAMYRIPVATLHSTLFGQGVRKAVKILLLLLSLSSFSINFT